MLLKWGIFLCCSVVMLALAWAPVVYRAVGQEQSARERVVSIVDRVVPRAWVNLGPVPYPAAEAVEEAESLVEEAGSPVEEAGFRFGVGGGRRESASSSQRRYTLLVQQAADRHGVDPRFVHALIEVESGYRADAVSTAGAMGLMQLMPVTAKRYGVADPLDPASNIEAGTRHLRALLDEFGPLFELDALAAYNAGESVVRRHGGIPPYPQTHRFVRRVLDILLSQRGWGGD